MGCGIDSRNRLVAEAELALALGQIGDSSFGAAALDATTEIASRLQTCMLVRLA
jgi:hypothetical protein